MNREHVEGALAFKLRELFGRAPGNGKYLLKRKDANGTSFIDYFDVLTETTLTTYDENKKPHTETSELHFGELRINYGCQNPTFQLTRDSTKKDYHGTLRLK